MNDNEKVNFWIKRYDDLHSRFEEYQTTNNECLEGLLKNSSELLHCCKLLTLLMKNVNCNDFKRFSDFYDYLNDNSESCHEILDGLKNNETFKAIMMKYYNNFW